MPGRKPGTGMSIDLRITGNKESLKIKFKTVNSKEGDHHGKLFFYKWKRRT